MISVQAVLVPHPASPVANAPFLPSADACLPYLCPQEDLTALELLAKLAIESAGAIYAGLQRGFVSKEKKHPILALFNSPKTHATLALPVRELSSASIRKAIAESDRRSERLA